MVRLQYVQYTIYVQLYSLQGRVMTGETSTRNLLSVEQIEMPSHVSKGCFHGDYYHGTADFTIRR
jgi:hypothetical protein